MTTSPLVLAVNPATGIRSVAGLIAAAKKDPGKLNYSTSGNGSAPHLGAALFCQLTGTQMTHIPYKGGAPAIQSVMAGDTQLTFGTSPSVLPQVSGGKLLALAVSTRERSPLVPELPGMKEAGLPEYNLEFWYGMFVPAGTPPAIVKKIYDATLTAMQQPSVKAALARDGTEVSLSASPEQFSSFPGRGQQILGQPGQECERQDRVNPARERHARLVAARDAMAEAPMLDFRDVSTMPIGIPRHRSFPQVLSAIWPTSNSKTLPSATRAWFPSTA